LVSRRETPPVALTQFLFYGCKIAPHLCVASWMEALIGPDQGLSIRRIRRFDEGNRNPCSGAYSIGVFGGACPLSWLHANRPLQDAAEFDENSFPPDCHAPNPEELVLQNDSDTLVRKALEMLPSNSREVLVLRELEGMSYKEIADITGMPIGTVMSNLSRARGRLR